MSAPNDESMIMYMMHMTFYQSTEAIFLFQDFESTNTAGYILGLIITFLVAVGMEALSFIIFLFKAKAKRNGHVGLSMTTLIVTGLYFLQLVIAFALMLLVMTFNAIIFLTVIAGILTGYAIFGFMKLNLQAKLGESGYSTVAEKCCT
mmetsp:Transcript_38964/g.44556  ORF Transcript_38964/g.44556 Transcript_38964/m.44556 type:complete len:148 (-) Transcript_38964:69-512(-)